MAFIDPDAAQAPKASVEVRPAPKGFVDPDAASTTQDDSIPDRSTWGKREDGSPKGGGFLGVLKRPGGGISTEISIGVPINGKETEIPTLVPTLDEKEKNWLLTHSPQDKMPESIRQKAVAHAEERIKAGKSPFAGTEDEPSAKTAPKSEGFFAELGKGLGEISIEDWKKKSMIAPIVEYTARSALGGIVPGLEPVTPEEQKQVQRSASETLNALKEGVANPIETGKAIAKKASDNPGAFTADLIKGLVYDPEMFATGALGRIGKLTAEAGTAAKVGRAAINTANTATQFGVLAGGAEGARAKLEGRDVNPKDLMQAASESVYTAVAFEAMHKSLEGTGRAIRGEPKVTPEMAPVEAPAPIKPAEPVKAVQPAGMPKVEEHTAEMSPEVKAKEQASVKDLNTLQEEADLGKQTENIIRKRINDYTANSRISHNLKIAAEKFVPDELGQEAITLARDSKDFSKLTPEQLKANELYSKGYKEFYERGKEAGVIKGFIEDYIPHIVDFEKSGIKTPGDAIKAFIESGSSRSPSTSGKSRFGKERKYETFEDLQNAIEGSGMVVKTKNAAEIWKQYSASMEKAILNKEMLGSLKNLKDVEGYPVAQKITEKEPMPRDWVTYPQMPGYAFHPDMAIPMKFVFDNTNPGMIMKGLNAVSQAAKRANVVGSLFHAKSLAEAFLLSDPIKFAKELATGFAGTKAALKTLREGGLGDNVDMLLREGLVVETPEDVSRGILSDIGKGADWVMNKYSPIKDTNITEKALRKVEDITLKPFDKLTWDFAATGFKTLIALKKLEEAKLAHPDVDPRLLAREISSYANNTFGSLNWFEISARTNNKIAKELAATAFNPTGRRNLQLLMFAPDWTVSTLRAFTTMFNKGSGLKGLWNPKLEADFARQYQLRNAAIYATVLNIVNNATSGHDIWENKDPTRIEFRDGTSMQLAKHSMEAIHWVKDPIKTLTNKLGFIPRAAIVTTTGTVPGLGPLKDKTIAGKAKAIGQMAIPFQAQSAITAPTGEGAKRALLGTLGLPVYGKKKE